jgi:glycerol-3-phosphate dehydrogenase subunit C
VRNLLDVLPAGRQDRRDQLPGAEQAQGAEGHPAPRPDHHAPDLARPCGHTGGAAGQLHDRFPALADPRREAAQAAAPEFAGRRFSRWFKKHPSPATGRKILYFHGCGTEYYEPWEGEKVVAILEHNGFEVVVPKQDCCGLPLQSSGLFDDARKVVLRRGREFAPYLRDDPNLIVVGNATSCTLMLKREAREILSLEDDPDLKLLSERTYDICELLLELHDRGELKTDFKPVNERIFYHAPCQQQGHWIGKPALELFALIPGLEVVEGNARCCGIAGTYGLKVEKYDIAMAVGADLFGQIRESGAGEVACDSETCRWQIAHATGSKSVHPIDYLHRAYGL